MRDACSLKVFWKKCSRIFPRVRIAAAGAEAGQIGTRAADAQLLTQNAETRGTRSEAVAATSAVASVPMAARAQRQAGAQSPLQSLRADAMHPNRQSPVSRREPTRRYAAPSPKRVAAGQALAAAEHRASRAARLASTNQSNPIGGASRRRPIELRVFAIRCESYSLRHHTATLAGHRAPELSPIRDTGLPPFYLPDFRCLTRP